MDATARSIIGILYDESVRRDKTWHRSHGECGTCTFVHMRREPLSSERGFRVRRRRYPDAGTQDFAMEADARCMNAKFQEMRPLIQMMVR
jgi:hypothetical protein